MPRAEFFTSLGLFVERDFLDHALCDELRRKIEAAPGSPGKVLKEGSHVLDEDYRRTVTAEVSDATRSLVQSRFEQLTPGLERHFETELRECQPPALLRYREGDFFNAHSDNGHVRVAARQISAVAFLNDERDDPEPGSYSGGSLAFFGLIGGEAGEKVGFPLVGEKGLLVAFPSDRIHSVTPVTRGERYSAVTWFV
jgi:SM-20-related protein